MPKTTEGTEIGGIGKKSGSKMLFYGFGILILLGIAGGLAFQFMPSAGPADSGASTQSPSTDAAPNAGGSSPGGNGNVAPGVTETHDRKEPAQDKSSETTTAGIIDTQWFDLQGNDRKEINLAGFKAGVVVTQTEFGAISSEYDSNTRYAFMQQNKALTAKIICENIANRQVSESETMTMLHLQRGYYGYNCNTALGNVDSKNIRYKIIFGIVNIK